MPFLGNNRCKQCEEYLPHHANGCVAQHPHEVVLVERQWLKRVLTYLGAFEEGFRDSWRQDEERFWLCCEGCESLDEDHCFVTVGRGGTEDGNYSWQLDRCTICGEEMRRGSLR